ncbi:MAG: type II secretion system major pseudopilin GspG [Alcanivoracaceae bacterium]|nr:type II secretion system major pseudopilin GspG [Alcanivoracaceae bacterium]
MRTNGLSVMRQRGFTLLEIMVVVIIIGLLAAIVAPNVIGQSDKARVEIARTNMAALGSALDLYKLDNGKYPTTEQGLQALVEAPTDAKNWTEPYIKKEPVDPWQNEYVYISPGLDGPYDLYSLGADGQEGGEGVNADISLNESR